MYEALAGWYEAGGLTTLQPSRLRKYEILLEFALQTCTGRPQGLEIQPDRLKELLVYDMYLREHVKHRPSFACRPDRHKAVTSEILSVESQTHALFPELTGCSYRELTKRLHGELFEHIFETPVVVLFSYEKRDPLTNNCDTRIVSLR